MSDGEAGTASARRGSIWVFDFECRPAQRFDIINDASVDQVETDRIHHQGNTVGFGHEVLCFSPIGQSEPVLKSRTAPAFDGQAQDRRLGLLLCNKGDTPRGAGTEGK